MSKPDKETLRDYTADLLTLETHLLNAVKKQKSSEKVRIGEAIELLHVLDKTLSVHTTVLEKKVEGLDGERKSKIKSKIGSFTGQIAGLVDTVREDPVSKMMRDDYCSLSMIAIGYTMLHTLALAAKDSELAELTSGNLSDIAQLITETSRVVPVVVASETTDDEQKAEEIWKEALKNTQDAWSTENMADRPEIVAT
ncbi:MAG TPA: hypothetical protein VKM36_07675 [Balneolaceae bacterium]|nr:hypothetical protein [Balneolaceae bacterium]